MIRRLINYLFRKKDLAKRLRDNGAYIGNNFMTYGNVMIDMNWPFLLHIGDDVEITNKVSILCHDYSWCVTKKKYGILTGGVGPVWIGDNVFIGTGAIILKGTHVGNDSIVGAGSVVSGTFPDGVVIAGNPAKVICSIDDYHKKRLERQYNEACEIVRCYREKFHCDPPKTILPAYFWLFENREEEVTESLFKQRMMLKGNYESTLSNYKKTKPLYNGYNSFLNSIK